ncbi:hypothetical protein GCM10010387_22320 [Streptomyces inusitatus]|uniref:Uncharacterized protein n=1 Tax=Streptomyces inusitatus TaxID=68221 RepID=A0A918PZA5_9ACTN|nr:LamG-like jellyroll fold domain-containing protein [Streptomyces inusitatus]GGZ28405.1 hypothetical protein GCM10010387_22320 [Streptomyces inusitatus]
MGLLVELGWGGSVSAPDRIVWTDITEYVDVSASGVNITRGASDEFADTQPGTLTMRLDNQNGQFSGPDALPGVPVRAAVTHLPARTGPAPWPLTALADDFDDGRIDPVLWPDCYGGVAEAGGRARIPLTPGAPAGYKSGRSWLLTGSQFAVKLSALPAAGGSSAATLTVTAASATAGTRAGFVYSPITQTLSCVSEVAGTDPASVTVAHSPTAHLWIRIREAAGVLFWETSPDGCSWTVLRSIPTPAWVGTDQVVIEMAGVRTGGAGDYAELDLAGAVVYPRFYGAVGDFPVQWAGLESTVTITATDVFKWLGRDRELKSCLAEEIAATGSAVAYYPLTETSGSSAGDLSGRGAPSLARVQAGSGGTLTFGAADGPAATGEKAPVFTPASSSAGRYLAADLENALGVIEGEMFVEFWFSTSTTGRVIMSLRTAAEDEMFILSLNFAGILQVEFVIYDAVPETQTVPTGNLADGAWHHVLWDTNLFTIYVDGVARLTDFAMLITDTRFLDVGGHKGARLWSGSIAHLSIYNTFFAPLPTLPSHYTAGTTAHAGETADLRIARLARYTGLGPPSIYGTVHDPVAGQGAGGQTALSRMREIETTESARLYAARDRLALDYASRGLRYNPSPAADAFSVEYADLETDGVQLKRDDQKLINTVTASRPDGATQRAVDTASAARYGTYAPPGGDISILKTSDNAVRDAATWLISRYAQPVYELREVPVQAYSHPAYLGILGADIGSHISVTGLPAQAPAAEMRVTVEGYTETIKHRDHRIAFHTSAAITDSVWVLDDPVYAELGTTTRLAY